MNKFEQKIPNFDYAREFPILTGILGAKPVLTVL